MKKHIITIILSSLFLSSFTHAFSSLDHLQAAQKTAIQLATDGKTRELLDILEKHHGDTYYHRRHRQTYDFLNTHTQEVIIDAMLSHSSLEGISYMLHTEKGSTCGMRYSNGANIMHTAAKRNNIRMVALIHQNCSKLYSKKNDKGEEPIFDAVYQRLPQLLTFMLSFDEECKNFTNKMGQTALHEAALLKENAASIHALLNAGFDASRQDYTGRTPIHLAVQYKLITNLEALLANPESTNAINNINQTPLDIALDTSQFLMAVLLISHGAIESDPFFPLIDRYPELVALQKIFNLKPDNAKKIAKDLINKKIDDDQILSKLSEYALIKLALK